MSTWSGTEYAGPEKNEWFEGEGRFKFPNGVVYEGEFRKGEFHGEGALVYPNGGRYQARWERGYAVEGKYLFKDELLYEDPDKNWQYVSQGDRRFYTEVRQGLNPAGKTLLTNEAAPPPIPKGTYDYGSGYFDPKSEDQGQRLGGGAGLRDRVGGALDQGALQKGLRRGPAPRRPPHVDRGCGDGSASRCCEPAVGSHVGGCPVNLAMRLSSFLTRRR
ncbi:unnamed protein product [Prorocentrum cordatum]|uniref:MORN repeat-containing protein 5 n=1 Tax=Prorocentrum cordatum TaxID=2364126 RepID=A0ABN9XYF3_9DINO|nr:unnamed protein product [Polarella glacialis]